jgi:tubulin monoglycylase TTLL3/8
VHVSDEKLTECRRLLEKMRRVWPQYGIDGYRNIWIVKPGDKSKGIG